MIRKSGRKVIISLTTKMFHPDEADHQVLFANSTDSLLQAARNDGPGLITVAAGIDPADSRKLIGLPPEWFSEAVQSASDVVFLIEADGSAGRSLKGYLPHEPVIPSATSLVIPVVGMDVLGKPLVEDFVHRATVAAGLSRWPIGAAIVPDLIVTLLLSPAGYRKDCPPGAKTVFFLNKTESADRYLAAETIAAAVLAADSSVQGVVAGSVFADQFTFWPSFTNERE
jgi:probable selenium-dependent hydroxylase accessory protein YqeC